MTEARSSERKKFFDIYIDSFDWSCLDLIKKGDFIVTLNLDHLENLQKNPDFLEDLQKADWYIADAISIVLLAKTLYKGSDFSKKVKKIPGIDLAFALILRSKRIAFLGSTQKNIEKIQEKFSDKEIFTHHGYFSDDEEKIFAAIKKFEPDLLLVAMGCPRQENLIAKYSKTLENTIKIGVGGAFDIWSGELKRAPKFWQNLNLEWLFRVFQEPFRIFRIFRKVHSMMLFFLSSLFDEG